MNIVHLTASTFHGGPERQMLGLARGIRDHAESTFLSFSEGGRCRSFLSAVKQQGFEAVALQNDTPNLRAAAREIAEQLRRIGASVLLCHGYKANVLGRIAARRVGIPVVAVSRGWTGESFRVRIYERLDRFHLRFMDHVVAVSGAQGQKVRNAGVKPDRLTVIPNAIDPDRFVDVDPRYRARIERFFRTPKTRIIGAAGRLSPEKGFEVFISAAARVLDVHPDCGFVLFGHGPCKESLQQQIGLLGLGASVVLGGFRNDLDRFIPQLDLFVQSSYTEGLPNVVLEACAASVPVVATNVGGTPEIIEDGVSGLLLLPGDSERLAERMLEALESEEDLRELGFQGRQRVLECFSFPAQVSGYLELFDRLLPHSAQEAPAPVEVPAENAIPEPSCDR
jgi:glycosyltransferase involved in cell wall biosynthesis